ncbi:hypothetical protein TgHK011_001082 [Trichoderma gracile]|nr:hypothetical protein TgHK011_001082 [Trichoderma gracile]
MPLLFHPPRQPAIPPPSFSCTPRHSSRHDSTTAPPNRSLGLDASNRNGRRLIGPAAHRRPSSKCLAFPFQKDGRSHVPGAWPARLPHPWRDAGATRAGNLRRTPCRVRRRGCERCGWPWPLRTGAPFDFDSGQPSSRSHSTIESLARLLAASALPEATCVSGRTWGPL